MADQTTEQGARQAIGRLRAAMNTLMSGNAKKLNQQGPRCR